MYRIKTADTFQFRQKHLEIGKLYRRDTHMMHTAALKKKKKATSPAPPYRNVTEVRIISEHSVINHRKRAKKNISPGPAPASRKHRRQRTKAAWRRPCSSPPLPHPRQGAPSRSSSTPPPPGRLPRARIARWPVHVVCFQ